MVDFKKIIGEKIAKASELEVEAIVSDREIPPNEEMGDYAFPCFKLAKILKKAPPVIANELKEKIEGENIGAQLELKFDTEATVKLVSTTSGAKVYKTLDSENGLQNLIGTGKELTLDSNNSSILYVDKNAEYVFSVITKEYGKNTVTQTIVIKVE